MKLNSHLIKGGWSTEAEEAAPSLFEETKGENKIKLYTSFMMKVMNKGLRQVKKKFIPDLFT